METESQQLPSKRERRAARKQEQRERQDGQQKRRATTRFAGWAAAILVIGALGYGIYALTRSSSSTALGETFPIQGDDHIPVGASHPSYNSNPPTSGWHYARAADWGVYQEELADEQLIHNLEHGGIWISYKDVDDDTKVRLEALAAQYPRSVVMTPREANDARIVLASWGRLEKMDALDEARIVAFIDANKNKSPERLAR